MSGVNLSFNLSVELSATGDPVGKYDVLVEVGSGWVIATTANLAGGLLPQCIATQPGDANQSVSVQQVGTLPGVLGPGIATYATVDANGHIQRTTTPTSSDLVVGMVYADGSFGAAFPGHYPGASAITVQDAGVPLATSATTLNFTGPGVSTSGTGPVKTVTITGAATPLYYIDASQPPYSMVADSDRANGGTDNTAALQAAVDAISAGGMIVIPGGDYRLASSVANPGYSILVNKRVKFVGNGNSQFGYGTTLACDAGVTGFVVKYADAKDTSFCDLSIISSTRLTTSQPCSWNSGTYTATIAAAGDFQNGQIVRMRGAGGLLPIPLTMVTASTTIGAPTVRLAGYGRFVVGDYLSIGTAFVRRAMVTDVIFLDKTAGPNADRWDVATVYAAGDTKLPSVNNGFAYRTDGGTSHATIEPAWPAELALAVTDNGMTWTCVAIDGDPVALTMARNASTTLADAPPWDGQQMKLAFDVSGRILSGGGTTTLVLDNHGVQGDATTTPEALGYGPFTGTEGTTDLTLEHHDSGVYATALTKFSEVTLGSFGHGFQGAGVVFRGSSVDNGGPLNCDDSHLHKVFSFMCYHAVEIGDGDASGIKLDHVTSSGARHWAFVDASALGTIFDTCQADGGHGYITGPSGNTRTSLRDCYAEGGTYSYLGDGTLQLNGDVGAACGGTTFAAALVNGVSFGAVAGASKFSAHQTNYEMNHGWEQYVSASNTSAEWRHRSSNQGDGLFGYHVWATQSNAAGKIRYSRAMADADAPIGHLVGAEWIPDRIYVGGGMGTGDGGTALGNCLSGRRLWTWSDSAPTTGTWVAGDRVWNNRVTDQVTDYWICVGSGTPGTWDTNQGAALAIPAYAIDWSTASVHTKTLGAGAQSFTFSNIADGQTIKVIVTGAASTLTWPTVKWPAGISPTQTASGTDVYTFVRVGSATYGSVVQAMA